MRKSCFYFLALCLGQSALVCAQTVDAFLEDSVMILDAEGKLQKEVAAAELGTPPLKVLAYNAALDLVQVEVSGNKVWLDTMDLRLNPAKQVKLPCQKMPTSQAHDQKNNSTIGFGAGCSQ